MSLKKTNIKKYKYRDQGNMSEIVVALKEGRKLSARVLSKHLYYKMLWKRISGFDIGEKFL